MNIPFAKFLSILTGCLFIQVMGLLQSYRGLAGDVTGDSLGHVPRDSECWSHQNGNFKVEVRDKTVDYE